MAEIKELTGSLKPKAFSRKLLANGRRMRETVMVVVIVIVQHRGYEILVKAVGIGWEFVGGETVALEQERADIAQGAELAYGDGAVGEGYGKFGLKAMDFFPGVSAGCRGEFAGEIGRSKAAVRGVGMGVAEAVGVGSGGEGTAASIGKGETAEGEIGRVGALASHGESIEKVNSIDK